MKLKQLVFAACFLLGIAIILFHRQMIQYLSGAQDNRVILATLAKSEGSVELKDSNQRVTEARENTPIHDQDTLSLTGGDAVRVRFADGMEVELNPGTIAFFENSSRGTYVTLRTGGFRGIARGAGKEKVLFVKDGVVLDPLGRNLMQPPLKLEDKPVPDVAAPPKPLDIPVSEDTLTDGQIANGMTNLRQPLIKCYAGNLKSNSKSKGEIYLSFTIEPMGMVAQVKILQSSFQDEQLSKCVSDVVMRARFDSFKGDPIIVNYPIYFE